MRSHSWHNVAFAKHDLVLGANALFCCKRFKLSSIQFIPQYVAHYESFFSIFNENDVSETELCNAVSLHI